MRRASHIFFHAAQAARCLHSRRTAPSPPCLPRAQMARAALAPAPLAPPPVRTLFLRSSRFRVSPQGIFIFLFSLHLQNSPPRFFSDRVKVAHPHRKRDQGGCTAIFCTVIWKSYQSACYDNSNHCTNIFLFRIHIFLPHFFGVSPIAASPSSSPHPSPSPLPPKRRHYLMVTERTDRHRTVTCFKPPFYIHQSTSSPHKIQVFFCFPSDFFSKFCFYE